MLLTFGEIKTLFQDHTLTQSDDEIVVGICRDTRNIKPGEIYLAIKGETHDGHSFLEKAFEKGASASFVQDKTLNKPNLIYVDDVIKAMGDLASYYRAKFQKPVIAITGSNGKTTTKEILTHVLSLVGKVISTQGNLNNHIGVPITIFSFTNDADWFVVEMGMNHFDEIRTLTKITNPTIGLITNVGRAHLEGVGGKIENVAKAKGELFEELDKNATAVFFNDCPYISALTTKARAFTFGFDSKSDVWADNIKNAGQQTNFTLCFDEQTFPVTLNSIGKHHVQNALAVFTIAHQLGLETKTIIKGIESFSLKMNRGEKIDLGNITLIDDTYNANPDSMEAVFNALSEEYPQAYKIAALGGMGELGKEAISLHTEVGKKAHQAHIDEVYAYGENSQHILKGYGYKENEINKRHFTNHEEMAKTIAKKTKNPSQQTIILFKGSRTMTMEKALEELRNILENN